MWYERHTEKWRDTGARGDMSRHTRKASGPVHGGQRKGQPHSIPLLSPHLHPLSLEGKGRAFMLSLPSHLSISSLLPGFSVVFRTGTVKTTQVVLEGWGKQKVEEWKGKTNYQCPPYVRIYTHMPQNRYMNNEMDRWMGSRCMAGGKNEMKNAAFIFS